jgi:acyl carrier protein
MNELSDPVAAVVVSIVAAQAMVPVDAVRQEATPESLGLDSLGLVEVVFAIEEAFDITVPFNANESGPKDFDVSTIGAVVAAVRGLVAERVS